MVSKNAIQRKHCVDEKLKDIKKIMMAQRNSALDIRDQSKPVKDFKTKQSSFVIRNGSSGPERLLTW